MELDLESKAYGYGTLKVANGYKTYVGSEHDDGEKYLWLEIRDEDDTENSVLVKIEKRSAKYLFGFLKTFLKEDDIKE